MPSRLLNTCACALAAAALLGCGDGYSRAEVRYNVGRDLAAEGEHTAAIAEFTQAISLDPGMTAAYYQRGLALLQVGEYRAAGLDLTAAIALDPGLADAYRYRITADMVTGNLDRAFNDSYILAMLRAGPAIVAY
jgi:tetratricopeptide (TPR) repeat protein